MKFPIIIISVLCLSVIYLHADDNKCSSCNCIEPSCNSLDFMQEISKIPKVKSTKQSIIAKYCFHFDTEKDSVWKLLLYERVIPLSTGIEKECSSVYSVSTEIDFLEARNVFSGKSASMSGSCMKSCIGNKESCEKYEHDECKINVDKQYDIYEYINYFDINSCFKNTDKISHLFDKYLSIKYELKITCYGEEMIPVSGSFNIYISEICTEEQIKKYTEYKSYHSKYGNTGHP